MQSAANSELILDVSIHDGVACPVDEMTWQHWFQIWWQQLAINAAAEISLHLTNDAEIRALNSQFRHKDAPTDVLAFNSAPLAVDGDDLPPLLGDIVISLDTAAAQASEQQHALPVELAWLASHGLLHLLGWDHPDPASLDAMLSQQRHLLEAAAILTKT